MSKEKPKRLTWRKSKRTYGYEKISFELYRDGERLAIVSVRLEDNRWYWYSVSKSFIFSYNSLWHNLSFPTAELAKREAHDTFKKRFDDAKHLARMNR